MSKPKKDVWTKVVGNPIIILFYNVALATTTYGLILMVDVASLVLSTSFGSVYIVLCMLYAFFYVLMFVAVVLIDLWYLRKIKSEGMQSGWLGIRSEHPL